MYSVTPCKRVISILTCLFNTFNEKCVQSSALLTHSWQNYINFNSLILCFFAAAWTCLSMLSSRLLYLYLIKAHTECGTTSQCSAKCWGWLQIKMPSPGCAHQAVQHCSPGRFTTYILFYGPFLIHHNTASILLTSPAKHTSLPAPSVFSSIAPFLPSSHDTHKHTYTRRRIQM